MKTVALAVIAVVLLRPSETVTAKSFVIVDEDGHTRATIGTFAKTDSVSLTLYDAQSKPHVVIGDCDEIGASILMHRADKSVLIQAHPKDGATLSLADAKHGVTELPRQVR